jgi:hypothetical protein
MPLLLNQVALIVPVVPFRVQVKLDAEKPSFRTFICLSIVSLLYATIKNCRQTQLEDLRDISIGCGTVGADDMEIDGDISDSSFAEFTANAVGSKVVLVCAQTLLGDMGATRAASNLGVERPSENKRGGSQEDESGSKHSWGLTLGGIQQVENRGGKDLGWRVLTKGSGFIGRERC